MLRAGRFPAHRLDGAPHLVDAGRMVNTVFGITLETRRSEISSIGASRRAELDALVEYLRESFDEHVLLFVCTHNSRRSQFAQVWAWAAARAFGFPSLRSESGGTEATAFAPPAIEALRRCGFRIEVGEGENPRVEIRINPEDDPLICWSKRFDAREDKSGFCAVMTCSSADADCPIVPGSVARLSLNYEDPKVSDGRRDERAVYDERCAQIAREMLYVFGHATHLL